jgi:hypothetical protein
LVRVAAGLLVAVLVLCGCWSSPRPPPEPTTTTRARRVLATRLPGEEVVGLCFVNRRREQGITQGEFVQCDVPPGPGFGSPGEIVGVTTIRIDRAEDEPPFGSDCPVATDGVVRARLPSGETTLLCLDTEPAYGNSRS